jgi:hypothetical protein
MSHEDLLLGEYDKIKVVEAELPDFSSFDDDVSKVWKEFSGSNPNARDEPKVRLNHYYIENGSMVVGLSKGISFANVMHSDHILKTKNLPATADQTYELRDGEHHAKLPFANATSVAGIILFDPDNSYNVNNPNVKTVLSVRSKKQATNPGSLGILVNGYVDVGEINNSLLIDNLYRETEEESGLKKEDIQNISFVGPSQTRGKSCDLVWIMRTDTSYEDWQERWVKMGGHNESMGVVPIKIAEMHNLVEPSYVRNLVLNQGIISDDLRDMIKDKDLGLHPMLESLYLIMCSTRMSYYLEKMKK